MSRHGHRHSRISRIINAKHRQEASEVGNSDDTDMFPDSDETLSSLDPCDPLQNTTCPDEPSEETEGLLMKRQADTSDEADAVTVIQTVFQVIDPTSQTLWQSSGADFPMTVSVSVSVSVSDELSISEGSVTTSSLPATSPADLPTTSITSSASQYTGTTKQRAPVSSPRVSPATSSQPHTSTPLVSFASTTRASTTAPTTTSTYFPSSSSSSTSYYWSETSQSPSSSSDFYGGPEQTSTSTGSGSGSGSSTNTGSSGSGPAIDPTTSKIVGGVVGSVAGLAFILVFLLYVLRRRGYYQRFFKGRGTETLPSSDAGAGAAGAREISERERPSSVLTASYFAPAFMKRWRQSTMTTRTESTIDSNSSERGFQKISGRKIAPVLTHGGDGYGGRLDGDSPTIPDCLIGLSPQSPTGGPLSSPASHGPPPASPFGSPLDTNYTREADEISSPARPSKVQLPVSSSVHSGIPTTVNPAHPIAQPQSAVPVQRPDSLGRSLPSFDGSRGSRFTESLDL